MKELTVKRVNDFDVAATALQPQWQAIDWSDIVPIKGAGHFATRFKIAYSNSGVYCLFDCEDHTLTGTALPDFADLWTEDVVEAFFWTDPSSPVYFEYELSPFGSELPLMVPNDNGTFMGWLPFHYAGDRKIRRAVSVRGGQAAPGASVSGWTAEFFVPFALLKGLGNTPPKSGTVWRANFYRIDYDQNQQTLFAWSTGVDNTFHDYKQFGTLRFE